MSEEELTSEELLKKIEEDFKKAKKLPGGIDAYIFMAISKEPIKDNNYTAIMSVFGTNENLAYLYRKVPSNVKRTAAIMDIKNIFSED